MSITPAAAKPPWILFRSLEGETAGDGLRDVLAGLTLAAVAIPEQMATARLGGFAPQLGFVAFIAAGVGFAVFGANRRLSSGGDSTITPIFASSLAAVAAAGAPQYMETAAVLALLVGIFVTIAGTLKLGWIADLLSAPVITGFMAGISFHILLSQAPSVLGVAGGSGDVYHRLAALYHQLGGISLASVAIAGGVFAVTTICEKLNPRIPGALLALLAASLATAAFALQRLGVAVLGKVEGGIPHFRLPHLGFDDVIHLIGPAFVVALVVMVQTAATTRGFSEEGEDPDINRDYIGVGLGSVLAGLFGAFPVNASPPRTAIVAAAGGGSQFAGLTAVLAVLLLAAFGATLLAEIPTAALAGVLLFVAVRIFHVGTLVEIWRKTKAEFALAVLTMAMIVILPIQTGVAVGIFLSMVHGVFTITRAKPVPFERVADTTVWWPASKLIPGHTQGAVLVMGFQAPLSFLNAYDFRRGMVAAISACNGEGRLFVLEASSIVEIDFTAASILSDVIKTARAAHMVFACARLESVRAQQAFDRFGLTALIGEDHLFHSVDAAIQALGEAPSSAS